MPSPISSHRSAASAPRRTRALQVPVTRGEPAYSRHARNRPNGFNQLLSVTPSDGGAATAFAYDGNGNQTSRTDASGVTQYVYGADDRLAGVALPGGGGSAYEYDANGLRVKKADAGGTTRYLLDGLSVIGQYGADGARQAFYVQSLARIDEVLSVVNGQGKHWYQADALGSVYTLTTATGEVRARGGYDVFGAPVAESGAAVGQPFGFTGREHELDAGLVYARARYLDPSTGLWDSTDPLGMIEGPNRYAYVRANPARSRDPLGLFSTTMHSRIIEEALEPIGASAENIAVLKWASREADSLQYQDGDSAHRHAMRRPGQDLATGIRLWSNFVVAQLAMAAETARGCDLTFGEGAATRKALFHLGFGMHAVMDAHSPFHRFTVWRAASWSGLDHIRDEPELVMSSPGVAGAIAGTANYWRAYEHLKRVPGGDLFAWAILLFGRDAYMEALWLGTQDPPAW